MNETQLDIFLPFLTSNVGISAEHQIVKTHVHLKCNVGISAEHQIVKTHVPLKFSLGTKMLTRSFTKNIHNCRDVMLKLVDNKIK